MPFAKGTSGNPAGRPPLPAVTELREAILEVEKKKSKKLLSHAIEQAYEDNRVLVAVLKKIIPDLKVSVQPRDYEEEITIEVVEI